jgi:anti-sigma factor RsiW
MKPIEPEELSAFVDGELDARRMREVEAALSTDPALRAAHKIIADADAAWRAAVTLGRFETTAQLMAHSWLQSPALTCAAALVLVVVRALPKLSDALALSLLLQLPLLIALMVWVVVLTRNSPDPDGRWAN